MKIYIVGTGGVGGYFGGLLAKAGNNVTFVARKESFSALKNDGLIVKSVVGDFEIKPAQVIENISKIKDPDLVLFTVKTYQTEEVAKELVKVINEKTIIISFQNGINNDEKIMKYISNTKVYPGVAMVISAKDGLNTISQTGGLRKLIFGDRSDPNNQKLKNIEMVMKDAGIDAVMSDDITRDLWKKFLFIIPFAGLTAMYRMTIGEILSNLSTKKQYEDCLNEVIRVAKSLNVNMVDNVFESIMTMTMNTVASAKSSLLIDVENNRQTEIETLHGTLIKLAKEKGVDVPINLEIYSKLN